MLGGDLRVGIVCLVSGIGSMNRMIELVVVVAVGMNRDKVPCFRRAGVVVKVRDWEQRRRRQGRQQRNMSRAEAAIVRGDNGELCALAIAKEV